VSNEQPKIVGIDLGTTNSLISIPIKNDKPTLILNERGERITPSVVTIQPDQILVGELARSQAVLNHDITISCVKRFMGTNHSWHIQGKEWSPETISSEILKHLKHIAELYLGYEIVDAVITVPAYFNDFQREATLKAGELAGLSVKKLFNEPTAAALAYANQHRVDNRLLVFDFGGGTLDITLLEVKDGAFIVRGVGGNTELGGIDFDRIIIDYIKDAFQKQYGQDLTKDPVAYQQLLIHAERAKIDLTGAHETKIMIPYVTVTKKGPLHLNMPIARRHFETLAKPISQTIKTLLLDTLESANLGHDWVQNVVLAGGSSRIPFVKQIIAEVLPKTVTFRHDLNPDEIVAIGAGVLAGIFGNEYPEMIFKDMVSHDLGLEDHEGQFITIIPKGAVYPNEQEKLFTTTHDNQKQVIVHVLQRTRPEDQLISLGHFIVQDLPDAPAGQPDICVTFSIDANGILNVRAVDRQSGVNEEIRLTLPDFKSGANLNHSDSPINTSQNVSNKEETPEEIKQSGDSKFSIEE